MRPAEPRGVDEPEVEAREIVDSLHPVRVARSPEAGMRGRPHLVALGDLPQPAREAAIAAGAMQDEQRRTAPAAPHVHVDAADGDALFARIHGQLPMRCDVCVPATLSRAIGQWKLWDGTRVRRWRSGDRCSARTEMTLSWCWSVPST